MLTVVALVLLAADAGSPAPPPSLPACIQVATDARYVPFGYNHLVLLRSGCSKPATCTVSTDVAPQPQAVELPANAAVEVTTFMGSPAQTFTAKVTCKLR